MASRVLFEHKWNMARSLQQEKPQEIDRRRRSNNMLLCNEWVIEGIKKETCSISLEPNEDQNATYQTLGYNEHILRREIHNCESLH